MADDPEDPRRALETALGNSARDWSLDQTAAWIYGIVLGWQDGLDAVAERHGWKPADVHRLRRLHEAFTTLTAQTEERTTMAPGSTSNATFTLDQALRIRDDLTSEIQNDIQALRPPEDFKDLEDYARNLAEQLIANGWVTTTPPADSDEDSK